MGEEDPPFSLHVSMDLALIPAGELSEGQQNAPNVAKIEVGGNEYYALMGRLRVEPIEKLGEK